MSASARGGIRPVLVTGVSGTLGAAFVRLCAARGLPCVPRARAELDLVDAAAVAATIERERPWAVVNAAGHVRVDDAEREPERCYRDNRDAAAVLAAACAKAGIRLVTFSTDLVFDGAKRSPYDEDDAPAPLSVYGRSKLAAEAAVVRLHPDALVVRTSAFFGPWDEHNFVTVTLRRLHAGASTPAADDVVVSPTYVPDLVHACLDLLVDGESGIWHLASTGALSWAELARAAATQAGLDPARVQPVPFAHLGLPAPRPAQSALTSRRGWLMPALDDALARYLTDRRSHLAEAMHAC